MQVVGQAARPLRRPALPLTPAPITDAMLRSLAPGDVVDLVDYDDGMFWNRHLYDRWPLVVKLSDRITGKSYRHVPPISDLKEDTIGVSGIDGFR